MAKKAYKSEKESDEDILAEARKRFKIACDAEKEQRELSGEDIEFRNGDQWADDAKKLRENERRPCLTINKMEQRVDQVTGDQRMNRMGPVIRTMNGAGSNNERYDLAQVMMGIIRQIEYQSNAKTAYDTAFDHAVGHGMGYARIITAFSDDDTFDQDILIKRINNSMRVYLDPNAEEVTKMDAKWGFITTSVDKDDYPDADWEFAKGDEWQLWVDSERRRIAEYFRLVPCKKTLWLVNGKTIIVVDESKNVDIRDELEEQGVTPERTREVDAYTCEWFELTANKIFKRKAFPCKYIPIVPFYGKELNVKGKTIYRGVIRHAKDPQRIYNYTRSASVEQVALTPKAPYIAEESQIATHKAIWQNANQKNYSVLPYKHKPGVPPPFRVPPPMPSEGWIAESNLSDQDIDAASGLYKASLGAPSNERSGKAINARKTEGDVGTYHYHDNRALSLQHVYCILCDMIPRVYDTKRMVKIINPDETDSMIEINQEMYDKESGQWVKIFDIAAGKYEIAVDVGASYTTQREMASQSMMELIQYAPELAGKILDLIAKNLDWPGADEIAERLKDNRMTPEQVVGEIEKAVQQALNSTAEQRKNAEVEIKRFDSVTKRINAIADAMADDDKFEVEVLKMLDDEGFTDPEMRGYLTYAARNAREQKMIGEATIAEMHAQ